MTFGNITTHSSDASCSAASSPVAARKEKLRELASRVKEKGRPDLQLDIPLWSPDRAAKQRARAAMGYVYPKAAVTSSPPKEPSPPRGRLKRLVPREEEEDTIFFFDDDAPQVSPTLLPPAKVPAMEAVPAPNIRVQNKYLPQGWVHRKSVFHAGERDTAWLNQPHVLFQPVSSLVASRERLSVNLLDLGDIRATYLTRTPGDWQCPTLRRTFIMAGRSENALLPQEVEGGRIILVISKNEEGAVAHQMAPHVDILIIDEVKTPLNGVRGPEDWGLLSVRRLATYLFAKRCGLKHLMMLDDNVASVYLSRKLGLPDSWKAVYDLFGNASFEGGVPYLSAYTYRPDRDDAPSGEELYVETPAFNSKIVFMQPEAIFAVIPDPKILLPINLKYWGEDYFRQYVLHFSQINVGVFPPSLLLIRRSKKNQHLAAKVNQSADCWLKDRAPLEAFPIAVQNAILRIKQEVERNLNSCVEATPVEVENEDDDSLAQEIEKQLMQDQIAESWDAFDELNQKIEPVKRALLDEDFPMQGPEPLQIDKEDLPPPTPDEYILLSRTKAADLPTPPPLPPIPVWFPPQSPDCKILIGVQKRYARMQALGQDVLEQRWEMIAFIQFLKNGEVERMFPAASIFDADMQKKAKIQEDYLEIFNQAPFQAFVKGHLDAITRYLELFASPLALTPIPKHIFKDFIEKASLLLLAGYDIFPFEEQVERLTPSHIEIYKGFRSRQMQGNYAVEMKEGQSRKYVRDPNKLLDHLRRAFEKDLKIRSLDFDNKMQALKERGYNESSNWNETHKELLHELSQKDEVAAIVGETLADCLMEQGNNEHYESMVRSVLPSNFRGTLMPYQIDGYLWGRNRLEVADGKVGVALCDDMGLGKTLQTIALLAYTYEVEPHGGPTLILCPASVTEYWKEELTKFLPSKQVIIYEGVRLKRRQLSLDQNPIVIATYEMFREDTPLLTNEHIRSSTKEIVKLTNGQLHELLEALHALQWIDKNRRVIKKPTQEELVKLRIPVVLSAAQLKAFKEALGELLQKHCDNGAQIPLAKITKWHGIVLDEAHHIKNGTSLTAQIVLGLKGRYRVALSGTPVQNSLKDLYSLMNFIIPGYFLSDNEVETKFFNPIKEATDAIRKASYTPKKKTFRPINDRALMRLEAVQHAKKQMQLFRDMIRPFFLRRLKEEEWIQNQISDFRGIKVNQLTTEEEKISYELTWEQRVLINHIYNSHRAEILEDIDQKLSLFGLSTVSTRKKVGSHFTHLHQLQQICSDPGMVKKEALKGYIDTLLSLDGSQSPEEQVKNKLIVNTLQRLINGERFESGKINACIDLVLRKLQKDPSNRVLIFIWYQETAQRLTEKLQEAGYDTHIITGNVKQPERHPLVKKFNGLVSKKDLKTVVGKNCQSIWDRLVELNILDVNGKLLVHRADDIHLDFATPGLNARVLDLLKESLKPVFILNISAGGEGINLQASNIVIDFDTWWNPASMDQAFARAKRIGQTRHVQHYTMTSPGVHIDTLIEQNIKQKRILQELIIGLGAVDPCLYQLRDYVIESLQRNGFKLVEDEEIPLPETPMPLPPLQLQEDSDLSSIFKDVANTLPSLPDLPDLSSYQIARLY